MLDETENAWNQARIKNDLQISGGTELNSLKLTEYYPVGMHLPAQSQQEKQ